MKFYHLKSFISTPESIIRALSQIILFEKKFIQPTVPTGLHFYGEQRGETWNGQQHAERRRNEFRANATDLFGHTPRKEKVRNNITTLLSRTNTYLSTYIIKLLFVSLKLWSDPYLIHYLTTYTYYLKKHQWTFSAWVGLCLFIHTVYLSKWGCYPR